MDEVDESETGSANLWSGPRKGAGRFLGLFLASELVERDRPRHRDVERVGAARLGDRGALIAALEYALEHGWNALRVISDSELLVKQIRGEYKVKSPDLKELYDRATILTRKLERFSIQHVLREKNRDADRLANCFREVMRIVRRIARAADAIGMHAKDDGDDFCCLEAQHMHAHGASRRA